MITTQSLDTGVYMLCGGKKIGGFPGGACDPRDQICPDFEGFKPRAPEFSSDDIVSSGEFVPSGNFAPPDEKGLVNHPLFRHPIAPAGANRPLPDTLDAAIQFVFFAELFKKPPARLNFRRLEDLYDRFTEELGRIKKRGGDYLTPKRGAHIDRHIRLAGNAFANEQIAHDGRLDEGANEDAPFELSRETTEVFGETALTIAVYEHEFLARLFEKGLSEFEGRATELIHPEKFDEAAKDMRANLAKLSETNIASDLDVKEFIALAAGALSELDIWNLKLAIAKHIEVFSDPAGVLARTREDWEIQGRAHHAVPKNEYDAAVFRLKDCLKLIAGGDVAKAGALFSREIESAEYVKLTEFIEAAGIHSAIVSLELSVIAVLAGALPEIGIGEALAGARGIPAVVEISTLYWRGITFAAYNQLARYALQPEILEHHAKASVMDNTSELLVDGLMMGGLFGTLKYGGLALNGGLREIAQGIEKNVADALGGQLGETAAAKTAKGVAGAFEKTTGFFGEAAGLFTMWEYLEPTFRMAITQSDPEFARLASEHAFTTEALKDRLIFLGALRFGHLLMSPVTGKIRAEFAALRKEEKWRKLVEPIRTEAKNAFDKFHAGKMTHRDFLKALMSLYVQMVEALEKVGKREDAARYREEGKVIYKLLDIPPSMPEQSQRKVASGRQRKIAPPFGTPAAELPADAEMSPSPPAETAQPHNTEAAAAEASQKIPAETWEKWMAAIRETRGNVRGIDGPMDYLGFRFRNKKGINETGEQDVVAAAEFLCDEFARMVAFNDIVFGREEEKLEKPDFEGALTSEEIGGDVEFFNQAGVLWQIFNEASKLGFDLIELHRDRNRVEALRLTWRAVDGVMKLYNERQTAAANNVRFPPPKPHDPIGVDGSTGDEPPEVPPPGDREERTPDLRLAPPAGQRDEPAGTAGGAAYEVWQVVENALSRIGEGTSLDTWLRQQNIQDDDAMPYEKWILFLEFAMGILTFELGPYGNLQERGITRHMDNIAPNLGQLARAIRKGVESTIGNFGANSDAQNVFARLVIPVSSVPLPPRDQTARFNRSEVSRRAREILVSASEEGANDITPGQLDLPLGEFIYSLQVRLLEFFGPIALAAVQRYRQNPPVREEQDTNLFQQTLSTLDVLNSFARGGFNILIERPDLYDHFMALYDFRKTYTPPSPPPKSADEPEINRGAPADPPTAGTQTIEKRAAAVAWKDLHPVFQALCAARSGFGSAAAKWLVDNNVHEHALEMDSNTWFKFLKFAMEKFENALGGAPPDWHGVAPNVAILARIVRRAVRDTIGNFGKDTEAQKLFENFIVPASYSPLEQPLVGFTAREKLSGFRDAHVLLREAMQASSEPDENQFPSPDDIYVVQAVLLDVLGEKAVKANNRYHVTFGDEQHSNASTRPEADKPLYEQATRLLELLNLFSRADLNILVEDPDLCDKYKAITDFIKTYLALPDPGGDQNLPSPPPNDSSRTPPKGNVIPLPRPPSPKRGPGTPPDTAGGKIVQLPRLGRGSRSSSPGKGGHHNKPAGVRPKDRDDAYPKHRDPMLTLGQAAARQTLVAGGVAATTNAGHHVGKDSQPKNDDRFVFVKGENGVSYFAIIDGISQTPNGERAAEIARIAIARAFENGRGPEEAIADANRAILTDLYARFNAGEVTEERLEDDAHALAVLVKVSPNDNGRYDVQWWSVGQSTGDPLAFVYKPPATDSAGLVTVSSSVPESAVDVSDWPEAAKTLAIPDQTLGNGRMDLEPKLSHIVSPEPRTGGLKNIKPGSRLIITSDGANLRSVMDVLLLASEMNGASDADVLNAIAIDAEMGHALSAVANDMGFSSSERMHLNEFALREAYEEAYYEVLKKFPPADAEIPKWILRHADRYFDSNWKIWDLAEGGNEIGRYVYDNYTIAVATVGGGNL